MAYYGSFDVTSPIGHGTVLLEDLERRFREMRGPSGYLGELKAPVIAPPTLPTYSLGRERMLQQEQASPQVSRLRRSLQEILTRARNRPLPAGAYESARALEGYGEGLGGVMSAASSAAQKQQLAELATEADAIKTAYEAQVANKMRQFQLDLQRALLKEQERRDLMELLLKAKLARGAGGGGGSARPSLDTFRFSSAPAPRAIEQPSGVTVIWGHGNPNHPDYYTDQAKKFALDEMLRQNELAALRHQEQMQALYPHGLRGFAGGG